MQLSNRLMAVAKMVSPGSRVADVGTDHGYIPIYLVRQGIILQAIAMDVNEGPLKRAEKNIAKHGLSDKIITRLSDGVEKLEEDEVKIVVIAGMGGNLMMKILSAGEKVLRSVKELILQPQSELPEMRKFLYDNNYKIVAEDMVLEDGKFYPMMKVVHGEMKVKRELDFIYGPCLLAEKNPVLLEFLKKEKTTLGEIQKRLQQSGSTKISQREQEIKQEMCANTLARKEYE